MRSRGCGLSEGSVRDMGFWSQNAVLNYRFGSVHVQQLLFLQDVNIEILTIAVLLALSTIRCAQCQGQTQRLSYPSANSLSEIKRCPNKEEQYISR